MKRTLPILVALLAFIPLANADESVPLFDGKTLKGWVNVNCAPGTFFVRDGEIVTTGQPTGYLRTEKQYENFILEMEWMHTRKEGMANSGLFVWGDALPAVGTGYTRGIEVQILCNFEVDWATSHGDVFSIWGARCKPDRPHPKGYERCLPSERRAKGPGEWNHYKVIANNGVLKLHVNGKEVSGVSESTPRKGYLALESEGSECRFRNLKITELPSTNPKPEEIATAAQGHVSLFDGLTLKGWKAEDGSWSANDGTLRAKGTGTLESEKTFAKYELIFDIKTPAKSTGKWAVEMGQNQKHSIGDYGADGKWHRITIRNTPEEVTFAMDGQVRSKGEPGNEPSPIIFKPCPGLEVRNLFLKELE